MLLHSTKVSTTWGEGNASVILAYNFVRAGNDPTNDWKSVEHNYYYKHFN